MLSALRGCPLGCIVLGIAWLRSEMMEYLEVRMGLIS
jgi:hypothetical protein